MKTKLIIVSAAAGVLLTIAGAANLTNAFAPGSRVVILSHNAYPDHGKYGDRLDRAIAAGVPFATEQDLAALEKREKDLNRLLKENEKLKKEMEGLIHRERHEQQVELLKHQNKITEERIAYLKEMERKLRQIIFDWRKAEERIDALLLQGIDSGEPITVTKKYWEEKKRKLTERLDKARGPQ